MTIIYDNAKRYCNCTEVGSIVVAIRCSFIQRIHVQRFEKQENGN